ncbi:MAG: twin-arginine translocation signal domain-containing protein [Petrimonas sp.]|nr:twin-arginine translocation signal domain-containing protein [Petrimonas sp.]
MKTSRRTFLKSAGTLTAGVVISQALFHVINQKMKM